MLTIEMEIETESALRGLKETALLESEETALFQHSTSTSRTK
jgi:hypothetical protein